MAMNTRNFPIQRYLVPAQRSAAPEGFVQVDSPILTGLPYVISLLKDLQVIVVLPTGLAVPWRDADPTDIGSNSGAELNPPTRNVNSPTGYATPRAPFRLVVQQARRTIGVIPLVAGCRKMVPDSGLGNLGAQLEILVLDWDIRAGSVRGPGNFGSRLSLAWRRANQGAEQFLPRSLSPALRSQLYLNGGNP